MHTYACRHTHAHTHKHIHRHVPWAFFSLTLTNNDISRPLAFIHTAQTHRHVLCFRSDNLLLNLSSCRLSHSFFIQLVRVCVCLCVCRPQTPVEGAATVLHAALSPALEGEYGEGYWSNGCREMTTPPTFDPQLKLSLWETSLQLLGLQ